MKRLIILIIIILGLGYFYYDHYIYFDQIDTSLEPIQNNLTEIVKLQKERNGVTYYIEPKAEYEIEALLIGKEKYSSWDIAQIIPYDLALVWGDFAKKENLDAVDYGQRLRHVNYSYSYDEVSLSDEYMSSHISNNHVIPANDEVFQKIKRAKINRRIHLKGYLVRAYIPLGESGNLSMMDSSMIRTDSGDGACEIIYVEEVW
jgi:hypothetical protein